MEISLQKEQFSDAYIRAVAAVAGFMCYKPLPDVDGIDWGIAAVGGRGTTRSPRIEFQLKCSSRDILHETAIKFPLEVAYYDSLRADNYQVPRILVVLLVPDELTDWLAQSEDELAMRRCGYWRSLRGMPDSDNTATVSVDIPRSHQFTVDALTQMMHRVGNGGLP